MTLSSKHPEYTEQIDDWIIIRDVYKGERAVKLKATEYLPATNSHIQDGFPAPQSLGIQAYHAYRKRARFSNFFREAVQQAVGMMHSQPPNITLPKAMEDIRSSRGEELPAFLRRINTEQLLTGRIGIMADLPTYGGNVPFLSTYAAERIVNWDDGKLQELIPQRLNLVVLDESESIRANGFEWETQEKYRVLSLGPVDSNEGEGSIYKQGVFTGETPYDETHLRAPSLLGKNLDIVPFVIINSADLVVEVDEPPLLDLANMCLTIYRSDADYRQNLFMQGQDTFVTIGANLDEDETIRTGAGARVDLPLGGDAKYVGVQSSGLKEQREALGTLESRAGSMGAQTLDTTSRERESGDSLRIRVAARTADMNQIADTAASGLERLLKICADWMGENPDEVKVIPNKEFGEAPLTGQTMVEIATARNLGWPISAQSMHELSVRRRITRRTFEEEQAIAEKEKDSIFAPKSDGDMNPEQSPAQEPKKNDSSSND